MSKLKRFFRNFLSLGIVNVLSRVLMGLAVIYLVRVLSPSFFGMLSYAQATMAYVIMISIMGIDRVGIRNVAAEKEDLSRVFTGVLLTKVLQAVCAYLLLLFFLFLSKKSFQVTRLAVVFGFMGFAQIVLLEWFYQGIEKMHLVALYRFTVSLLHAGGIYFIVKSSEQLHLIPFIQLAATLVGIVVLMCFMDKEYRNLKVVIDMDLIRRMFRESVVIGFSFAMLQLLYNFDIIFLGLYHNEKEVGFYSAAYRLFIFITMPLAAFFEALFPVLVKTYNETKEKFKKLVGYIDRLAPAVAFPLVVCCFFAAPFIIRFLMEDKYEPSILLFRILLFSTMIAFLNYINTNGLIAINREKRYFWSLFIAGIGNVVLDFIFVPVYGATGAVATTAAAEFFGAAYAYVYFRKNIEGQSMAQWLKKPLTASLLMVIYFLLTPDSFHIIPRVLVGLIIYFAALWAMNFIDKDELRMLVKIHPWLHSISERFLR